MQNAHKAEGTIQGTDEEYSKAWFKRKEAERQAAKAKKKKGARADVDSDTENEAGGGGGNTAQPSRNQPSAAAPTPSATVEELAAESLTMLSGGAAAQNSGQQSSGMRPVSAATQGVHASAAAFLAPAPPGVSAERWARLQRLDQLLELEGSTDAAKKLDQLYGPSSVGVQSQSSAQQYVPRSDGTEQHAPAPAAPATEPLTDTHFEQLRARRAAKHRTRPSAAGSDASDSDYEVRHGVFPMLRSRCLRLRVCWMTRHHAHCCYALHICMCGQRACSSQQRTLRV